jgi:hypothetical protein
MQGHLEWECEIKKMVDWIKELDSKFKQKQQDKRLSQPHLHAHGVEEASYEDLEGEQHLDENLTTDQVVESYVTKACLIEVWFVLSFWILVQLTM